MSIEKMELVNVAGLLKDLDTVLLKCCQSECFHIENAGHNMDSKLGFKALSEDNPYSDTLKRLYSLSQSVKCKLQKVEIDDLVYENVFQLDEYVEEIEEKFKDLNERIRELSQSISLREQALVQLKHLHGLNVDFQQIFACKHICVRFGKLPADSFPKLSYYDDKPFIFVPYERGVEFFWGVYFMPTSHREVVDDIFESLYFERVRVPDFVKGTADNAEQEISGVLVLERAELLQKQNEVSIFMEEEREHLNKVFSKLKYSNDTFELRRKVSVVNDKFYLVGFVPSLNAKRFIDLFEDMPDVSVLINPPELDHRLEPPTKLKNNIFSKPFGMFVEMYGLPSYTGFNPTMFVAITYTLLFGIMFGDLGQGLVIVILGALLWKIKKIELGAILVRVGFSSAFFGLIYGSVFGFENLLDPLYPLIGLKSKPLEVFESTNTILIGAISIGVLLIIASIVINIFIGFKKKDFERAIFGNNGIAGLIFYSSILIGGVSTLVLKHNLFTPLYLIFLIILPLLVMFFREPLSCLLRHKHYEFEGIGNFIATNFFEVFEFLLGYATNTLSFVRVGGFILSHAGMMSVVMLLAEGTAAGVSPIVIIIGNIFVMGMEGLIVGIQVLRLEFYEIFSRFYEGDGHAFKPVKVEYDTEYK